jgi:nicotinamide-nucleotide amidase
VSEATALEMARGALERSRAQVAVAATGVAGPGGGTAVKPVGTVCIGWATPDGATAATLRFEGDRGAVRAQTVAAALRGLLARLP